MNDFAIDIHASLSLLLHLQLHEVVLLDRLCKLRMRVVRPEFQAIHRTALTTSYLGQVLSEEAQVQFMYLLIIVVLVLTQSHQVKHVDRAKLELVGVGEVATM